jgi:hypothetical protein
VSVAHFREKSARIFSWHATLSMRYWRLAPVTAVGAFAKTALGWLAECDSLVRNADVATAFSALLQAYYVPFAGRMCCVASAYSRLASPRRLLTRGGQLLCGESYVETMQRKLSLLFNPLRNGLTAGRF